MIYKMLIALLLMVQPVHAFDLQVNWLPYPEANNYRIYYNAEYGNHSTFVDVGDVTNHSLVIDENFAPIYWFKVMALHDSTVLRAMNWQGSVISDWVIDEPTLIPTGNPPAPSDLVAVAVSDTQINLTAHGNFFGSIHILDGTVTINSDVHIR
jgi:hypothetical protein